MPFKLYCYAVIIIILNKLYLLFIVSNNIWKKTQEGNILKSGNSKRKMSKENKVKKEDAYFSTYFSQRFANFSAKLWVLFCQKTFKSRQIIGRTTTATSSNVCVLSTLLALLVVKHLKSSPLLNAVILLLLHYLCSCRITILTPFDPVK